MSSTGARCEYQGCRRIATTIILIELDPGTLKRRICEMHEKQAQGLTERFQGIAYRLIRI
jgi:hypothetical protein